MSSINTLGWLINYTQVHLPASILCTVSGVIINRCAVFLSTITLQTHGRLNQAGPPGLMSYHLLVHFPQQLRLRLFFIALPSAVSG